MFAAASVGGLTFFMQIRYAGSINFCRKTSKDCMELGAEQKRYVCLRSELLVRYRLPGTLRPIIGLSQCRFVSGHLSQSRLPEALYSLLFSTLTKGFKQDASDGFRHEL